MLRPVGFTRCLLPQPGGCSVNSVPSHDHMHRARGALAPGHDATHDYPPTPLTRLTITHTRTHGLPPADAVPLSARPLYPYATCVPPCINQCAQAARSSSRVATDSPMPDAAHTIIRHQPLSTLAPSQPPKRHARHPTPCPKRSKPSTPDPPARRPNRNRARRASRATRDGSCR